MAKILANIPAQRLVQPEEVAELIAFFASDKCGFVLGHVVTISGGWALLAETSAKPRNSGRSVHLFA